MSESYKGSCLCGTARFEVQGFEDDVGHCHCSMCRKFHGAAFATIASVKGFRWLQGESALTAFVADNGTTRTFCSRCGSSLTFSTPKAPPDVIEVALGAFDDDIPVQPDAHIFVGSGAHWTVLEDSLPKFEAGRDSNQTR